MKPALLLLLAALPAGAVWDDPGGSTMHFLRLGAGARALGMAEAYGPVAAGADAVYWNPAGLAKLTRPDFTYSHAEMLGLLRLEHLAYARPLQRWGGTWGVSATFFHQESIPLVTNANQRVGSFAPHGESVSIAYARHLIVGEDHPLRDRGFFQDLWRHPGAYEPLDHAAEPWTGSLALGGALKFVSETIYDESAWAVAFDGGAHFRPVDLPELAMSATLRNLGTRPKFREQQETLPLEGSLGAAIDLDMAKHRLIPAFEAAIPSYGKPYGKLGFEWSFPAADGWRFALRGGYKTLTAVDLGPLSGLAGGIGLAGRRLSVDFAFQPMAALGEVYRASLGWRFDAAVYKGRPSRVRQRRGAREPVRGPSGAVRVEPVRPRY
ncbi:MAG: hypothetical protein HYZ75_10930 [Elusimicrobia bacterium]|nr:hypothetical protein [Elusimicrobiota bacterium]